MPDPYAADWRPEYTGDDSYGDVGTGADGFGAALYDLFKAGRVLLPEAASTYTDATIYAHGLEWLMDPVLDIPGCHRRSHGYIKRLRGCLHDVLRLSSIHVEESAKALVDVAASYAATDEAAARKFRQLMDDEGELYDDPYVDVPAPPNRYDEAVPTPTGHPPWSENAVPG